MGKYSQYEEEAFLSYFFRDKKGMLVEIGAADGINNSNSRFLIENGWSALLVEPNKKNFSKLLNLYTDNSKITIENVGCSNKSINGVSFYIDKNDEYEQLSTFSLEQKHKCINLYNCDFSEEKIDLIKTSDLFAKHSINDIDFLSVDTESFDTNVILGIDFDKVDIKLICVEHLSDKMVEYLKQNGYSKIHNTQGNIFFCKK
jgi:FkbM family methyltransferase